MAHISTTTRTNLESAHFSCRYDRDVEHADRRMDPVKQRQLVDHETIDISMPVWRGVPHDSVTDCVRSSKSRRETARGRDPRTLKQSSQGRRPEHSRAVPGERHAESLVSREEIPLKRNKCIHQNVNMQCSPWQMAAGIPKPKIVEESLKRFSPVLTRTSRSATLTRSCARQERNVDVPCHSSQRARLSKRASAP